MRELEFVARAHSLTEAEWELIARLKTVKGAYAQILWINGTRGRGQVSLRLEPLEYWTCTSDLVRHAPVRDQMIDAHDAASGPYRTNCHAKPPTRRPPQPPSRLPRGGRSAESPPS